MRPTLDASGRVTKRRNGPRAKGLEVADSRPEVEGEQVVGVRCTACRHPSPQPVPRCPVCFGPTERALFGPGGVVWATTVVHLPVTNRKPPFALAYVDLDDGPRILAHVDPPTRLEPGSKVNIVGARDGDVTVAA